jgi:hypothetical protein
MCDTVSMHKSDMLRFNQPKPTACVIKEVPPSIAGKLTGEGSRNMAIGHLQIAQTIAALQRGQCCRQELQQCLTRL